MRNVVFSMECDGGAVPQCGLRHLSSTLIESGLR